ncbi:hypothetical protein GOODEAATRI_000947 [Goodea atripinnis]|uniref:NF-X1-type domain-containing protein n=1 Tax=Goodea atripinnis TaxID=208336 RepID=A0ABV0N747_9TELE
MRCGQASVLQCDKVCGALLNCGEHCCMQVCHSGACQPCQLQVQQDNHLVISDTIHMCQNLCHEGSCGPCSLTSTIRCRCSSMTKKVEHRCPMICGYKLNCGLHRCQEPCHKGNCEPCWQSSESSSPFVPSL